MHGLVNKAIECFLRDTYGDGVWTDVSDAAGFDAGTFEAMLCYEDELTDALIGSASDRLDKPADELLEDLGTYIITNGRYEPLRRLMRFSGETFEEFLLSVDELPERTRLALPDLRLAPISVTPDGPNRFEICCGPGIPGFGSVLSGVIRAMADDYGSLVTLSKRAATADGAACLHVTLHEVRHSEGRSFVLAPPASP